MSNDVSSGSDGTSGFTVFGGNENLEGLMDAALFLSAASCLLLLFPAAEALCCCCCSCCSGFCCGCCCCSCCCCCCGCACCCCASFLSVSSELGRRLKMLLRNDLSGIVLACSFVQLLIRSCPSVLQSAFVGVSDATIEFGFAPCSMCARANFSLFKSAVVCSPRCCCVVLCTSLRGAARSMLALSVLLAWCSRMGTTQANKTNEGLPSVTHTQLSEQAKN